MSANPDLPLLTQNTRLPALLPITYPCDDGDRVVMVAVSLRTSLGHVIELEHHTDGSYTDLGTQLLYCARQVYVESDRQGLFNV